MWTLWLFGRWRKPLLKMKTENQAQKSFPPCLASQLAGVWWYEPHIWATAWTFNCLEAMQSVCGALLIQTLSPSLIILLKLSTTNFTFCTGLVSPFLSKLFQDPAVPIFLTHIIHHCDHHRCVHLFGPVDIHKQFKKFKKKKFKKFKKFKKLFTSLSRLTSTSSSWFSPSISPIRLRSSSWSFAWSRRLRWWGWWLRWWGSCSCWCLPHAWSLH